MTMIDDRVFFRMLMMIQFFSICLLIMSQKYTYHFTMQFLTVSECISCSSAIGQIRVTKKNL